MSIGIQDRIENQNDQKFDKPSPFGESVSALYTDMPHVFQVKQPTENSPNAFQKDGSIDFGQASSPYPKEYSFGTGSTASGGVNQCDVAGTGGGTADLQNLVTQMTGVDQSLAQNFSNSSDGGASVLSASAALQAQMLNDPNLAQDAPLDNSILSMNQQLANMLSGVPGGEQMLAQIMQFEQTALSSIEGGTTPATPTTTPLDTPTPTTPTTPTPIDTPTPTTPAPIGTGTGTGTRTGTDLSSLFSAGDSGVTAAELQHAVTVADALPEDMKQSLLANHVSLTVDSGFAGGAQGQNNGTSGSFYADSGMADQAEVHELYEMYGQTTSNGPGSWSDSKALGLADAGMNAVGSSVYNEGDLNDTVGNNQGDGDHMTNAFVADFFATHPGLSQDTVGQSVLTQTALDDPALTAYIAQAQGLTQA